jgi:four helix bundle protein
MIRASRSVTANIAEGYGRHHYLENVKFCRYAKGSLTELEDHIDVAFCEPYLNQVEKEQLLEKVIKVEKILSGYIKFLLSQKEEL